MNKRIKVIAQKRDQADKAMKIAKQGLSQANKRNPFISKSQAMTRINEVKKWQKQLAVIWNLEFQVT